MGVTWSMDAIAFISPNNVVFLIADICNALQGVFIFILFVMKRRVLDLIQQRFASFFLIESVRIIFALQSEA